MDDVVDREIARALAIVPSPEFVARIRQRIATEPAPHIWRRWWLAVAAATCAVATAAIVVRTPPARSMPARPELLPARRMAGLAIVPDANGLRRASVQRQWPTRPPDAREPDILIDPREARAIRWYLEAVRTGRFDPGAVAYAPHAAEQITIAPIVIDPLPAMPEGAPR